MNEKTVTYAVSPEQSRGRLHPEARSDFRTIFQRDRDRIIHSTAFRRLMHKTQVFVVHEGDLFRTRLTHSLEVAQVARTLARRLGVNEDLAELVALAHDLGHPPFGHTGEDALAAKMRAFGGFDHNAQALRIVSEIEEHYPNFRGLNLSWESLEGIAKHNGPVADIPWAMADLAANWDLELGTHASLEAQLAAISDDIAYNHHDVLDGLRSGLLCEEQFDDVPLLAQAFREVDHKYPGANAKTRRYQALSQLFGWMVEDVYNETNRLIKEVKPCSADDIRKFNQNIARFSDGFYGEIQTLRAFLFKTLYRHSEVIKMRELASEMLSRSFDYAMENPEELPADWLARIEPGDETAQARLVSDYISGMTDRYLSHQWQFAHKLSWS